MSRRLFQPKTAALLVTALAFHVDTLVYYLPVPLMPRYARELGLSQMQVGALLGTYAVCLFAATWPVARLTDRVGRRAPMLWGLLGLAATTLLFAFSRSYALLLLARALQGVAGAFTWLPGMALLADHFPDEERGRAMGTAFAGANLGGLAGPFLGGFLDERFGHLAPFLVAIALVLLDALARVFLLPAEAPMRKEEQLPAGLLLRHPVIRLFVGAMLLSAGLWALLESTMPLDLANRLGTSGAFIGLCLTLAVAAHTLTSPWMGHLGDRWGRVRLLRLGLVLIALLLPLPALMGGYWKVVAAMVAIGACASLVMSPCAAAVAAAIEGMDSKAFASGFALLNMAYSLGLVLGPFLGGALVTAFGLPVALVIAAGGFAAYLIPSARITPL